MNAYKHAEISVKKRGGKIEDYYPIHFFMDSTKELCSDNRHRILHNLWGIRRVIIPKNKGKYFVQKPPKGRKSATIKDIDAGLEKVIRLSLKYIHLYPEFHFIGKNYFEELSPSMITLKAYVESALRTKLKKQKSQKHLIEGNTYFSLSLPKENELNHSELKGLFNLLRIKPFTIFEMHTAINGEKVGGYYPDFGTF